MKLPGILIFIAVLMVIQVKAQDGLTRYEVGNSGCSAAFFAVPDPANISFSPDSSMVYTMESTDPDGITCSLIAVDLAQNLEGDAIEEVLSSYLDFLKAQLEITHSDGYTKGYILPTHPSAHCMRDSWSDDKSRIAVMGCSNGDFIIVLLVFSNSWKDISEKKEGFFQSIRFPGD
jgi:hypothetical protein